MLRNLVLALAVGATLLGALCVTYAGPAGLPWLVFGLLLLVSCVFERVRYKRLAAGAPDARFLRTDERFKDPTTGVLVRVYADPATGERAYVRE